MTPYAQELLLTGDIEISRQTSTTNEKIKSLTTEERILKQQHWRSLDPLYSLPMFEQAHALFKGIEYSILVSNFNICFTNINTLQTDVFCYDRYPLFYLLEGDELLDFAEKQCNTHMEQLNIKKEEADIELIFGYCDSELWHYNTHIEMEEMGRDEPVEWKIKIIMEYKI